MNHISYDSYGNIVAETNPLDPNAEPAVHLFGYTGRPFDEATQLQNNLNRWYDAAIGQWLSNDPIGFEAGDANLRRYVGNDPLNATDPDGLERQPILPGKNGVWRIGRTSWSAELKQREVRSLGGNAWFHPDAGKPIQYRRFEPVLPRPTTAGQAWAVEIRMTGNHQADLDLAEREAKKLGVKRRTPYKGQTSLKGTWHHKSFNPAKQTFVMELVDSTSHGIAKHTGAYSQYLDWAADTLTKPEQLKKLSNEARSAIRTTLEGPDSSRVMSKVRERGLLIPQSVAKKLVAPMPSKTTAAATKLPGTQTAKSKTPVDKSGTFRSRVKSGFLGTVRAFGIGGVLLDLHQGVSAAKGKESTRWVGSDGYGHYHYYTVTRYKKYIDGLIQGENVPVTAEEHEGIMARIREAQEDWQGLIDLYDNYERYHYD